MEVGTGCGQINIASGNLGKGKFLFKVVFEQ